MELVNDARTCTCFECLLIFHLYLVSYGLITNRNMVRALMCLELIMNVVGEQLSLTMS